MIYAIAAVLVLILDQGLKYYVTVNIALDTGAVPIIPGILDLVNIHNTGAAFGILDGGSWRWIFVVIALLFIVIAVFAIRRGLIKGAVGRWALVGMLSGAIGNCIDRVLYGYVVDMFKPVFLEGTFLGAIFNVADMFISCCGILFCIYILFSHEFRGSHDEVEEAAPEQAKPERSVRRVSGGSHARGGRTHGVQTGRRVPAREARSEYREQQPAAAERPARTPIPVQQPRPQRARSAQAQQARPIDPANPFAEWENPQPAQSEAKPAEPVKTAEAARPAEPVRRAEPVSTEPAAAPKSGHEFTLEEILAEFSDK